MKNTRLIMTEGLPGTGKSTNSHFLSMQIGCERKRAKWIHEVAWPHPVVFFNEASLTYEEYSYILKAYPHIQSVLNQTSAFRKSTVGVDLLDIEWNHIHEIGTAAFQDLQKYNVWTFPLDKYADFALEKWACFTEKALRNENEIYIIDSSLFQFQIFTYMWKNAPYEELEQFILKLIEIVKPLNPSLIYFYRENPQNTIDFLENLRGKQFIENMWERDKAEPYYHDKPAGAEGFKQFLLNYAETADKLFDASNCRKASVEITKQDWNTYENSILSFLGMERKPYRDSVPPNGIFRNEELNQNIEVEGLLLKDPYGTKRILTPKSDYEFYVECLPVILRFNGENQTVISGEQISERWTISGTQFVRI